MILTDRDKKLLDLIARNGVVSNEHAKMIYGDTSRYHLKRLVKLSGEGYIKRKNGSIILTKRGKEIIGAATERVKIKTWERKYRAQIVIIELRMPDWRVEYRKEIKRESAINRSACLYAIASNNNVKYGIYQLTTEKSPKDKFLYKLVCEIRDTAQVIERAVVFCHSAESMRLMTDKIAAVEKVHLKNGRKTLTGSDLKEFCLLRYPEAIDILNRRHSAEFNTLLAGKFPGIAQSALIKKYADYRWKGHEVSILVTNDQIKKLLLTNHYEIKISTQNEDVKPVIIVCRQCQFQELKESYPKALMAVLNDEMTEFIEKPAPSD